MLTEQPVREEIKKVEGLIEAYSKQLQIAAKTSSTITIMDICDSMNIAEAWIDAFEFVLEEREKGLGLTAFV
jgi:predicted DNA-binding protein YlxM (UPF0122 family)